VTVFRHQSERLMRAMLPGVSLTLLVASCSISASSEPPESDADRTPGAVSGSNRGPGLEGQVIRLPIDKYSLSGSALEAVEGAVEKVTAECMKRLGHTYLPTDAADDAPAEENRRYGIQDPSRAAAYGYRPYSVVNPPRPDPKALPYSKAELTSLSGKVEKGQEIPAGTKAANGEEIPQGGCRGEADRTVRAPFDYSEGVEVARTIYFEGFEKSIADPTVKKIFQEWSACMADKGYSYDSPLAAMGSPEFSRGDVTARERAVAQADISCKKRVDLVSRWNTVESATEKRMIRENSETLNELLKRQNAKVTAAHKILKD
jgi:hypothetical protein